MISLNSFVNKYKGKQASVPWGYKGQCVSLVQRYLNECLGYVMHPRGNAKDYINTLINEGIAKKVTGTPKAGDILVWGSSQGGGYGHIAIAINSSEMFDQNNSSHDNCKAGIGNIFSGYTIMRPVKSLVTDVKKSYVNIPAWIEARNVYNDGQTKRVGQLKPKKFGGLTYEILADNGSYVKISTRDFGDCWVKKTKALTYTDKPEYDHGSY